MAKSKKPICSHEIRRDRFLAERDLVADLRFAIHILDTDVAAQLLLINQLNSYKAP